MDYLYKLENINRLVKLDSVELDKYSLEERKEGDTIDFDTGGELVRSEIMLSFLMKKDENK